MAIVEVVKYYGESNVFAWKYPSEELGTWTQLIVNESQEAILFKDGKALDVFPSGRHTLDVVSIPILNKIINLQFGIGSPFSAEVWYVNKLFKLDVKWGTASPIQIQDPENGSYVHIRAHGMFGIQVEDSKQFLEKLVGTISGFDEKSVIKYFRELYITKVKDAVLSYLQKKSNSILEINAYIDDLSEFMRDKIEPEMLNYGIKIVSFHVNEISIPEEDSEVKNDSMGAGMGVGFSGVIAESMPDIASNMTYENKKDNSAECPKCHFKVRSGQKFCGSCGYDIVNLFKEAKKEEKKRIVCAICGTENKGSKFCMECGKKYIPCPECGGDMNEGATVCKICGYEMPEKCPSCGCDLPKGTKFCPECGTSMAKTCPKCGIAISGIPKFCPECGESLR